MILHITYDVHPFGEKVWWESLAPAYMISLPHCGTGCCVWWESCVGKLCGKVVWESCVGKLCGKVVT
jgi:hypothetical protein